MRARRHGWGAALALACVLLAACTTGRDDGGARSDRLKSLQKAVAGGDAAAIAALHLEDAQVIPPDTGEPVKGRPAIEALWERRLRDGLRAIVFKSGERRGEGETTFEQGQYVARDEAGDIDVGKYFIVWKRVGPDWFVSRYTWASDLEETDEGGQEVDEDG